jgi:hypothetical protein
MVRAQKSIQVLFVCLLLGGCTTQKPSSSMREVGLRMPTPSAPPPAQPISVDQIPGYNLARAALANRTCLAFLDFKSTEEAVRSLNRLKTLLYYPSRQEPLTVARTDFEYIWLYPLFFAPQAERFKLEDGTLLNGLEMWERFFELPAGSLSVEQFQSIYLTHEFSHPHSKRVLPDDNRPHANNLNTLLVVEHCFPDWVPRATLERLMAEERGHLEK